MKNRFSAIIQDINDGENVENYLLVLAALVVAVLNIFEVANDTIIASTILAVLSMIIYSQIKSDRLLRSIRKVSEIRGIRTFYPDRQNVPSLENRLLLCHEEVAIMGLQLSAITHSHMALLKKQAIKGCHIKFLMMNPIDGDGNKLPWVEEVGKVTSFVGLHEILISNILHLSNWLEKIPDGVRNRVEIKLYSTIPTASILLIDKDKDTGTIKVEPILHGVEPSERSSFVVDRSSSPTLYQNILDSFNDLWSEGQNISDSINLVKNIT